MKKLISALCLIAMLLCLLAPVGAMASAATKDQVTYDGGIVYYDKDGKIVSNVQALGDGGSVVSVSKTATQHTKENQFLVELQVRTTQDLIKLSSGSPDAAVTLILDMSSSMDECVKCGHKKGEQYMNGRDCHEGRYKTCDFQSRASAVEAAAKQFLTDFAAMGMSDVPAGEQKPRRMVSVIVFNQDARVYQTYVNVADSTTLENLKTKLTNIGTAQGTNIEGALQLAHNIIDAGRQTNGPLSGINYLYTILLTDGEPSMGMTSNTDRTSTTRITGDWNGSYYTEYVDIDEALTNANDIKAITPQSRIYSLCLGQTINHNLSSSHPDYSSPTYEEKRFTDDMKKNLLVDSNSTLKDWLLTLSHSFYTDAGSGLNTSIMDNFTSIMNQIQIAAQAWEVRDPMGPHMEFVQAVPVTRGATTINNVAPISNGVITWDLLKSNYDPDPSVSDYDETAKSGILGYTYRYIVELDNFPKYNSNNQNIGYPGGDTPANGITELDYAVENTTTGEYDVVNGVDFLVPEVEGYTGTFSFKKVDDNGKPVTNMTFHIDSPDDLDYIQYATTDPMTGVVTFRNIPSGHAYHLHEQTVTGYAPLGEMNFRVDWAQPSITQKPGLFYKDGNDFVVVNTIVEHDNNPINLTINKEFYVGSRKLAANDPLLGSAATGHAQFELDYPFADSDHFYLNKNALTTTYVDLNEGTHTVTEIAQTLPGHELVSTTIVAQDSETGESVTITGNSASFNAERLLNKTRTYTLTFKNVYRQLGANVSVNKTFWAHSLTHDGSATETGTTQMTSGYSNVTATLELYNTAEPPQKLKDITLTGSTWSWDLGLLPEGSYVLKESAVGGSITDYDYEHSLFTGMTVNGTATSLSRDAQQGIPFTVQDGKNIVFALQNHYIPYNANLHLQKSFHGDISTAEQFVEIYSELNPGAVPMIAVDIYKGEFNLNNLDATKKYTADPLILEEKNGWSITLNDIPEGTYTLVESTAGMQLPGYELTVNHPIHFTVDENSHGEVLSLALSNTYTRKTGSLTVKKVFDETDGEVLTTAEKEALNIPIQIKRQSDGSIYNEDDPIYLNDENNWSVTIENVPFDEYELIEVITSNTAGATAHVPGYSLVAQWSDAFISMEQWEAASSIDRTVTNTYSKIHHEITFKKQFTGDFANTSLPEGYTVFVELVRMKEVSEGVYEEDLSYELGRIELKASTDPSKHFTSTAQLPNGTYKLRETVVNAPENYTNTAPSFALSDSNSNHITFDSQTGLLTVAGTDDAHTQALTLTVTNHYTPDNASVTVTKYITGQLSNDLFTTKNFYVDLYQVGNETPVGSAALNDEDDVRFTHTFYGLNPTAQYYLVERNTAAENPTIPHYGNTVLWMHDRQNFSSADDPFQTKPFTPGPGANLSFNLVNTYNRNQGGPVYIQKAYDGLDGLDLSAAQVTVYIEPVNHQIGQSIAHSVTLTGTTEHEVPLTVGTYRITEIQSPTLTDYALRAYSVMVDGNPVTDGVFTVEENTQINIVLTNHYARDIANLTLSKTFSGDIKASDVEAVELTVSNGAAPLAAVRLPNADGSWMAMPITLATGTYTVSEKVTLKSGKTLNDYAHTRKWTVGDVVTTGETASVTLDKNDNVTLALENTYTRNQAPITVRKTITGDLDKSQIKAITLNLYQGGVLVTLAEPVVLSEANGWAAEFSLPTGEYLLEEVITPIDNPTYPLEAYTNTATWATAGGTLPVDQASGKPKLTLGNASLQPLTINLTNTYALNPIGVTFIKNFVGYTDADMPKSVTFQLTNTATSEVTTVTLPDTKGAWQMQASLPAGEYTVVELVDKPAEGKRHTVTYTGLTDGKLVVAPNYGTIVTCTNQLDSQLSVRLPLSKNVAQGGTLPPAAQMQFRFLIKGGLPNGVAMNFAAESGGSILNCDAKTCALDVLLDNSTAFKGYVEFTGFGDALAGVKVTISEDLYPYLNAEEAAAAGWKYDSASYDLSLAGSTVDAVKTSLTCNGKPAAAVAFGNTFTQNMPAVPETGDSSSLLLWLLALCTSGAAILLIRKRKLSNN